MRLDLPALTWPRTVIVTRPTAGASPSAAGLDRKSTRLNSSHSQISYAVFCLKKKKYNHIEHCLDDHVRQLNLVLLHYQVRQVALGTSELHLHFVADVLDIVAHPLRDAD